MVFIFKSGSTASLNCLIRIRKQKTFFYLIVRGDRICEDSLG